MKKYNVSTLLLITIVVLVALGLLTWSVYLTDDVSYAKTIDSFMTPLGFLGAILCGLTFANYVIKSYSTKSPAAINSKGFSFVSVGFALIAILAGWLAMSTGIFMAVAAVLAGGLAVMSARYAKSGQRPSPGMSLTLIVGAFAGGVLPGLVLSFILSFMVSQRYCELSSSKCL